MPRIALCPAPAQERQKILAVAAVPEFFSSLLRHFQQNFRRGFESDNAPIKPRPGSAPRGHARGREIGEHPVHPQIQCLANFESERATFGLKI